MAKSSATSFHVVGIQHCLQLCSTYPAMVFKRHDADAACGFECCPLHAVSPYTGGLGQTSWAVGAAWDCLPSTHHPGRGFGQTGWAAGVAWGCLPSTHRPGPVTHVLQKW
eukprot:1136927-Pelagomonas_calceolata.AAC.10